MTKNVILQSEIKCPKCDYKKTETMPTTPTESEAALPHSGAILPNQTSGTQLALAGLVLVMLGAGAVANLRQKRD